MFVVELVRDGGLLPSSDFWFFLAKTLCGPMADIGRFESLRWMLQRRRQLLTSMRLLRRAHPLPKLDRSPTLLCRGGGATVLQPSGPTAPTPGI